MALSEKFQAPFDLVSTTLLRGTFRLSIIKSIAKTLDSIDKKTE
jgi:hypothetical protein